MPDTRLSQNVHAIGDRANGIILDVFESTLQGVNVTALRPRLEHAQMMTDEDLKRLGKLGGKSPSPYVCPTGVFNVPTSETSYRKRSTHSRVRKLPIRVEEG